MIDGQREAHALTEGGRLELRNQDDILKLERPNGCLARGSDRVKGAANEGLGSFQVRQVLAKFETLLLNRSVFFRLEQPFAFCEA